MAMSQEELIAKAMITADAIASAGKLNPQQAKKFLDYVVDESVLSKVARVLTFESESWEANKIGLGRRVAVPATAAVDPGVRRGVSTSKITLTPKEIMLPIEIDDIMAEINVEVVDVKDHIMQMMAKKFANDIEELFIGGDTLGPHILESDYVDGGSSTQYVKDQFLALNDGLLKKARAGHVVDAAGANIGAALFGQAQRALPTKFRKNKAALRWLTSPDLESLWQERVSTRSTSAGDSALSGGEIKPFGIGMMPIPLMDLEPKATEHLTLANAADVKTLLYAPIVSGSEVVTLSTLAGTPTTKLVKDTDYEINYTTGAFNKKAGGAISDGATVKITYETKAQLLLTNPQNLIIGIGRQIRLEKDRNIFKRVDQYALTCKVAFEIEETDAIVLVKNIGTGI